MTVSERIRLAGEWDNGAHMDSYDCADWGNKAMRQFRTDEEEIARLKGALAQGIDRTKELLDELSELRAKLAEAEKEIAEYKEAIAVMNPGYFRDAER